MAASDKLSKLLAPTVEGLGYEFVGLEYKPSTHQSMLRVYIDHENGIMVDDCAKVSRQISAVMDVEDPIKSEYTLEVSSPGLDRPLFTVEHYQRFKGNKIKCKLRMPFNGRRNFTGELVDADEFKITMSIDNEAVELYIDDIEKANIIA